MGIIGVAMHHISYVLIRRNLLNPWILDASPYHAVY